MNSYRHAYRIVLKVMAFLLLLTQIQDTVARMAINLLLGTTQRLNPVSAQTVEIHRARRLRTGGGFIPRSNLQTRKEKT
jgi:hypothetical protein